MKNIDLEVNIKNLSDTSVYALCIAYATKDLVSSFIAGKSGLSIEKVEKDIEKTADQYFANLREKHATNSFNIKLSADQIKWLISDDPNLPKPPDVI